MNWKNNQVSIKYPSSRHKAGVTIIALLALILTPLTAHAQMLDFTKAKIWLQPEGGERGGHMITVDIRKNGLGAADPGWYNFGSFAPNEGLMVLLPAPGQAVIEPGNVFAPVDVLMADEYGTIVQIAPSLVLAELGELVASDGPVLAIIYLAGGSTQEFGIKPGDHVRYKIFKTRPTVLKPGDKKAEKPGELPWRTPNQADLEDEILRKHGETPPPQLKDDLSIRRRPGT